MQSKTTLPISEARKRIFEIVAEVQAPGTVYTLTEKGKPKAVVMSASEFESWAETLEVMHKFPTLKNDMADIIRDRASHVSKTYTTLNQLLARQGLVLREVSPQYGTKNTHHKTKRRKGAR